MGDILKDFSKPFVVACIPAFNEERTIAGVIVRAIGHVDRFLVCDGGARSHERNHCFVMYPTMLDMNDL